MSNEYQPPFKACVFHYEFVVIHPFMDGNGRIGRLWHTLILSKWNPIFAWLPIESMVYERQQEYYRAINECNALGDSTLFIEFMLSTIIDVLKSVLKPNYVGVNVGEDTTAQIIEKLRENPRYSARDLSIELGLSQRQIERKLAQLKSKGIVSRMGSPKHGTWIVN